MFLASLDIKNAFYSIPVHKTYQKYLKFLLKGEALQFVKWIYRCHVVFDKVLKAPFIYLRQQGFSSVVYVDDTILGGNTFEECQDNVFCTLTC